MEIEVKEKRIILVPNSGSEFINACHSVLVQRGAGAGIEASDADYIKTGAEIMSGAS